jgi:hypothetical protein
VVIPSKVGPFDFGNVVTRVRTILRNNGSIDIELADDLPKIIGGVPIRVRSIQSLVSRDDFLRNPTACGPLPAAATFTSREGGTKADSDTFTTSNCGALAFSPKLQLIHTGETKLFGHPGLKAIVTQPDGQANIAKSDVLLPDLLRPETVRLNKPGVLCPGASADTRSCPAASRVGTAKAFSPLLPQPLSGPVHIIQNPGNVLPRLAIFVDGLVTVRLDAQNSIKGIRTFNQFEAVPDLPVSRFELDIKGGAEGILKNGVDACTAPKSALTADSTFTAHNGKQTSDKPILETPVCAAAAKAKPRVSISLRKVRSGKPVLKLRIRKKSAGAKFVGASVKLPKGLKAAAARKGIRVNGSKRLGRSKWKLSKRGTLTIKKLGSGVNSISATLRRGSIRSTSALRSKVRRKGKKKPRLAFRVKVTDRNKNKFTIRKRVRPKS